MKKTLTASVWLLILTGCGGGGDSPPLPPQPPSTPVITTTPATPMPGQVATLSAASSDPQGHTLSYAWDFGDSGTGGGASVTHPYANEGSYPIKVTVTNTDNLSASATHALNVVAQAPAVPTLTLSDTAPMPGEAIALAVGSSDPQGSSLTYSWDFGDGTPLSGTTQSRTWIAEGSYPLTITVTNGYGKASSHQFTVAVAARPPVIGSVSASPQAVKPYDMVTATGSASDPQGSPLSYSWDFKDGVRVGGTSATHAYSAEGTFAVTLTVTNGFGKTSSSSSSVSVLAQAPRITTIGWRTVNKPNDPVPITSSVSDPQGSAISYAWKFGDGTTGTGSPVQHAYATEGVFALTLTATNAFNKSSSLAGLVNVVAQPPTAPTLLATPGKPKPNDVVTFTAASSDPQGSVLTYTWTFGDGAVGTGPTASHAYAAEGTYGVAVTVTDGFSKSASTGNSLVVAYRPPDPPVITPAATTLAVGTSGSFSAAASDPGGYAVSYDWDFGDGSTATHVASVTHSYASTGRYTITVTATNTLNKSSTGTASVAVIPTSVDNQLSVWCTGPDCGAIDTATYRGTGKGIWRYNNTTSAPATINLSILGVAANQQAIMVLSNGAATDTSLPFFGTLASPVAAPKPAASAVPLAPTQDAGYLLAHAAMAARNRQVAAELISGRGAALQAAKGAATPAAPVPHPAPAIGATRTWTDYFGGTVAYSAAVAATCTSGSGRSLVFWVDPTLTTLTPAVLSTYTGAFCGSTGGFDRTVSLLGDAWGSAAAIYPALIQDSPTLQDVNLVFLNVPSGTSWGGYFYGGNNYVGNANAALAFFVNGPQAAYATDYYISALVHELTHMINFYQRTVAHGVGHDTWLEESSAMMTEDIVGPALSTTGYDTVYQARVPSYYYARGNYSLINWSTLSDVSYGMGGSFGAFLSRRYGLAMYLGVETCGETVATSGTSYQCVDALIRSLGGQGFADEFARFGVSIYNRFGATGVPTGFGYPSVTSSGYTLPGFDLSPLFGYIVATGMSGATSLATSHLLNIDTFGVGATTWTRNGVTVPPYSTLVLVIE